MATHTSATVRKQASDENYTPHGNQTTRTATQACDDGPAEQEIDALNQKIGALAEIICSAGDEYAGTLFVLMGMMEQSAHPDVLAHTVKHLAFTRCGEFNLFGMVDDQIAVVEGELFAESRAGY